MGVGAAIAGGVAVAGVAGSVIQGQASKSAANAAAEAQRQAAQQQAAQQAQTRADLLPYNVAGQNNLDAYGNFYKTSTDQLGNAFNLTQSHIPQPMTEANLVNTPGYQFNLSQGLRAVQNSAAAKGLGVSGAALTGAAQYATGLADSTYQNQFNNQQSIFNDYANQAGSKLNQLNSIYQQIGAPVALGENAAAQTGNLGQQAATQIGNDLGNAGNAQAAGITGQAQGTANALNAVGSSGLNFLGVQNALTQNSLNQARTNALNGGGGPIDSGSFDV